MAEARRIVRPIISLCLIGVTVLGFMNVYGDNTEVIRMSEEGSELVRTRREEQIKQLTTAQKERNT